jgi:hypothetical protein
VRLGPIRPLDVLTHSRARALQVQDAFRELHDLASTDLVDIDLEAARRCLDRIVTLAGQHGARLTNVACCGCRSAQLPKWELRLSSPCADTVCCAERICTEVLKDENHMALLVEMLDPAWYPEGNKGAMER